MTYSTHDVPVRGGTLRVGDWNPNIPDAPVIVAAHGVTASHLSWALVAEALPEVRLIAPDLRGRGRSSTLPGPFGMTQHATDLAAVSDALDLGRTFVIGHSMGAYVALVAADLFADMFAGPLLIDGGLPLDLPPGVTEDNLLEATIGPAAQRLTMTFPTRDAYRDFWKQHPAFANDWSTAVEAYADYDLQGEEPGLRASTTLDAIRGDATEPFSSDAVVTALAGLDHPVALLTAPRGFIDDIPGLYTASTIERWRSEVPLLTVTEVPDVNHYTIVMSARGAAAVAREVRRGLAQL